MASAQQKPKKERGTRNSKRHNGKASKNSVAFDVEVSYDKTGNKITKQVNVRPRFTADGNKLTGKGKPSGKSFLGVSIKRLQAKADAQTWPSGIDGLTVIKAELQAKRDRRNITRKMFDKAERARQVDRDKLNAAAIVDARRRRDGASV